VGFQHRRVVNRVSSHEPKVRVGSYDLQTAVNVSLQNDTGPGKVVFVGDPSQVNSTFGIGDFRVSDTDAIHTRNMSRIMNGSARKKFYGGGYGVPIEPQNRDELQDRSSTRWTTLENISRLASLFLSMQNRETFLGDLQERYRLIEAEKGSRAAQFWFWREVLHSIISLALDALKNVSGLVKLFRRIGS
jgi:hypothetical protein